MIISRTPFRVSFFGGGTDYPSWYLQNGGAVLSTSINRYCYITCRRFPPFFPNSFRIVWSHIEPVSSISEILHPAVREALRKLEFKDSDGLEIHHQGDLPARSGMGSSSAFANGLLYALYALRKQEISKSELYLESIDLERNWIKDHVGSQDQVATAIGGLNVIRFLKSGLIEVERVTMDPFRKSDLAKRLMLFYSGSSRTSSTVANTFVHELAEKSTYLRQMEQLVFEARDLLLGTGSLDQFGELLHQTWMMKRKLSHTISNDQIDSIYDAAREAGAIGGKLLGAGGAGFLLFYVRPESHASVKSAMSKLVHVPFGFDDEGVQLLNNLALD